MSDSIRKMTRRRFLKSTAGAAIFAGAASPSALAASKSTLMLGGPVPNTNSPEEWTRAVLDLGYRAAYCPLGAEAGDDEVRAYEQAANKAGITIAEVGAWSNPIDPDQKKREAAIEKCRRQLDLADRIGARCCVNVCGSRSKDEWAGPHPDNLTDETFDLIVETTRGIIDAVKPTRTFFTLETMPWAPPDSPDSYLRLIRAIDRDRFAAHLDPVNLVCSPQRYFRTGDLIRECFAKFGPLIKSAHAKDIILSTKLTTHLDEIRPGLGGLDYATLLTELRRFPNVPLMLEHLGSQEEYRLAAEYVRSVDAKI